jgi:multidrug efflux pump subunit AcrB
LAVFNPVDLALKRPVTVLVAMVALIGAGGLAWQRIRVDIFPALNLPVVYVCQPYGGMDPQQMEGLIANYYEYHFLYINGIHHVESRNVQGVCLMKLFFHPGTDMAQAMAETVGYVNRSRAMMPPGTVPPFIMRFDTGSVPVGYLVLNSETKTVGEIQDQALFKVRPMFASIPGVSAPPPFGGNARTVVVRADPDRLRAYNISPDEVVRSLTTGNTISPSGSIRTPTSMPLVPSNAMVVEPKDLGNIAIRPGVFLRDVAPSIQDSTDIPTGYALVNGRRAVYILVTKRADASTLDVVNRVRAEIPKMRDVLPPDISVRFEFDQSPVVTNSMRGVAFEAALAAGLVALVVLVFLRDWRGALVVAINIPLALAASLVALWACGQTLNIMTLGGLALAVGILVDEALVEVENIHARLPGASSVARAVRLGNADTAVPRLLAMMCVLAVFLPVFFMQGAARGLFAPLALAVAFSMVGSYLLSSTLVPVLCVWLLRRHSPRANAGQQAAGGSDHVLIRWRWSLVPAYLVFSALAIWQLSARLGTEIFPEVDNRMFQFRLRAPDGTRIEETEQLTREALRFIGERAGADGVDISLGYVGVVPSSYPINSVYLWTGGPEEAVMRVKLTSTAPPSGALREGLRRELPAHLARWLTERWVSAGLPVERVAARVAGLRLAFEPADIVSEVMSFGSPAPVEVVVSGPKMADNRKHAEAIKLRLEGIPSLRDLQFSQSLDYPTVDVRIDRERAAATGVTAEQVARSLLAATSSSRFVVPNYWRDPASGIGYQVQVEIPQALMRSGTDVETLPVKPAGDSPVLLRDVADVREGTIPGQIDRYNMRRLVSMTAGIEGEDLGRVAERIAQAIGEAGKPPAGVQVDVRGQVAPMREMFQGLGFGLIAAVAVILLLLTAYFQSVRLAMAALATVPAALAGVALLLALTGTTLNIQSFMGAIMAVGVAVANAILVVAFAQRANRSGVPALDAACQAIRARRRPVLMTSIAMVVGMVPMALGLGEGGGQVAPLGKAVIGGLLGSTLAALFVLPAVLALVLGAGAWRSASLSPDDPESPCFDPVA